MAGLALPDLDYTPTPRQAMRNFFSRCQPGIHTPSVVIPVADLTLIRAVGRAAPSKPPPAPSRAASRGRTIGTRAELIVSYGNQPCAAPGGLALRSCTHFLPVWTEMGRGAAVVAVSPPHMPEREKRQGKK